MTPGIVQHNIPAMNAYMNYSSNVKALAGNLQKLSSAYRINSAADDAAGLAISEKMRAQITGLEVAQKNAKDGISLVQTAEGALTEVHSMLNRMVTLAEQSANGTYADDLDREQLQKEIDSLSTEINRIANSSNFNGIKLLDGSLGSKAVESIDIIDDVSSVDFSDGITVSDDKGLGAQSKFEISLDQAFSEGDKLTLYFNVPQANGGYVSQTLELTAEGDNSDVQGTAGSTGKAYFKGVSIEQQLKSIKETLEQDNAAALSITTGGVTGMLNTLFGTGGAYTVKIDNDANKLIIEANDQAAVGKLSLSDVVVSDATPLLTRDTTTSKVGVDGTASTTAPNYGDIERLIGGGNVQAGDKLKFEFTLAGGTTTSATVEITSDMISDVQDSGQSLTAQIVEKLKNTRFDDNETTRGVDESQYKVSDFFDVEANKKIDSTASNSPISEIGSIAFRANSAVLKNASAATDFTFTGAQLAQGENSFTPVQSFSGASVNASTTTIATVGTPPKDIDAYSLNKNLAVGDTITVKGKLVDGRDFSVTLTGGTADNYAKNTFAVGNTKDLTVTSIAAALNDAGVKVTVGSGENTVEMSAGEIFGATKMFTVSASTNTLKIENNHNGAGGTKGITGKINSVMLNTGTAEASGQQLVDGVDKEGAQIKLTFNKEDLEYGTAVTIGSGANAKTFELVASDDAAVTSEGNVRVVVEDLADAEESKIVDAFRDAINAQLVKSDYDNETNDIKVSNGTNVNYSDWAIGIGVAKTGDYRKNNSGTYEDRDSNNTVLTSNYGASGRTSLLAQVDGNTITLETRNIGKDVKAIGARMTYGVSGGVGLDMVADDNGDLKLKAGDTVKINGDTYQFDTTTRNLQGNNKLIKLSADEFNDKEAVAKAIKLAVEEEDKSVTVRINDDNSVTLTAAYYNGKYTTPTAEKDVTGNGGLTLQIGDTSDDFNRMTVSINDMHTDAMGLGDISVLTQDDAAAAIDKIKSAINYVSDVRGTLGATQNRLDHTINNLSVMQTNIQDAEAAIRDTDVAAMMMEYTKNNIKVQAAQAMLAQANQLPQGVLQMMG